MEDLRCFHSTVAKAESQREWALLLFKSNKNQNALRGGEGVGIMRASAEGGNRTLIPGGNTILSRARLPIPPLRLVGQVVLAGCFAINLPYAPQSIPLIRRWSSKMSARQDAISPYSKADPPRHLRPGPVCTKRDLPGKSYGVCQSAPRQIRKI